MGSSLPRYTVAGVTGRVGGAVAAALLEHGVAVRAIVRRPEAAAAWSARGAETAMGSLGDPDFLAGTLRGAEAFFTLVPENLPPHGWLAARHALADSIAAAVRASRVPHVVMMSAIAAVLPAGNGPARPLHYLEQRLRDAGTTLTALRAAYFQDNVVGLIDVARHQGIYPNLMPSADAAFPTVATIDVGRLAAGELLAGPTRTEVVDVFGPVYSTRDFARSLGAAVGRDLTIVDIPPAGHVAALTQGGLPLEIAEAVAEMMAAFGAGRIRPAGDRQLTGRTTVDEVIAEAIRRASIGSERT
jgi:uncharacterized protein YbjT (DUF2867 family)